MNNEKRQEDFKKSAEEYDDSPDAIQRIIARTGFEFGAEHGYQYAVDKACEWLREHLGAPNGIPQAKSYNDAMNELITEFRKGMEE